MEFSTWCTIVIIATPGEDRDRPAKKGVFATTWMRKYFRRYGKDYRTIYIGACC